MFGDSEFSGGPHHIGICPTCGMYNGTTYDGMCEECEEETSLPCPVCGMAAHRDDLHKFGKCSDCMDYAAEEFTERFIIAIGSFPY